MPCAIAPRAPPPPTAPARTRPPHPPCADPAPLSPPGHEPPPGGPKPAKRAKRPRSYPFFGDQTAARLPPRPYAPGPLVRWDKTETESEARIMSYGRNRQSQLSGPRSYLFFAVQTAARLRPHPDAPGPLLPWDETVMESGAPIMSYGPRGRAL